MKKIYTSEIRANNINWFYNQIKVGTIQDKCISVRKLTALASLELGISINKGMEYLEILTNAGKIKVDGDDIIAVIADLNAEVDLSNAKEKAEEKAKAQAEMDELVSRIAVKHNC